MNTKVNLDFLKNVPIKVPKIKSRKIFNGKTGSQNHLDIPQSTGVIHRSPSKISTISSLVDEAPHYDYSFGPSSLSNDCEIRSDYESPAVHTTLNRSRSSADVDKIGNSKKSLSLPQRLSKQYKGLTDFKIKHLWAKKTVVKKTEIDVMSYAYTLDEDERGSIRSGQDLEFHHIPSGPRSRSNTGSDKSSIVGESRPPKLAELRKQSQQSQQSQISGISGISDNLSIGKIRPNQSTLFGRLHRKSIEEKTDPAKSGSLDKANSDEKAFRGLTGLNNIYGKARKKMSSKIQKFKARRQESTGCDTQHPKTPSSPEVPVESSFENRRGKIKSSAFRTSGDSEVSYKPPGSTFNSGRTYIKSNAFRTSGDSDDFYIPPEPGFGDRTACFKSSAFRTSKDSDNSYSSNPKSPSSYLGNNDAFEETPTAFGPIRKKQWNLGTLSRFSTESEERAPPKCLQERLPLDESDEWLRRRGAGSTPKILQTVRSQSSSESEKQSQVSRPAPPVPKRDIRPQWSQCSDSNTTIADVHRANQGRNRSQSIDSNSSDAWIPEQFRRKSNKTGSQENIEEDNYAWAAFSSKPSRDGTKFNPLQKRKSIDIFLNGEEQAFEDFDHVLENVPVIQVTEASPTGNIDTKRRASIVKQEIEVDSDSPPATGASRTVNSLINKFEHPSSENDGVLSFDESESLVVLDGSPLWSNNELDGRTVDEEGNVVLVRPVSPSPSRLSQTLRTSFLPENLPSCSYNRTGAISPIGVSRTSSSESASSTDVQTCIENTINLGLHSDIPFSFYSPSGSRRTSVNDEVNANPTPSGNICNGGPAAGMRRFDTLEDLNKTDLLGSKSSLVDSDDNSFASLETAKSKDTTDSSDFKSISTTYSGQERSPIKTTVTVQPKIPPPVMPKPKGKNPAATPVLKMLAPPPPVPIKKSIAEVKRENLQNLTKTKSLTREVISQKMEPQQIVAVTGAKQKYTKRESSLPPSVNRLRVQDSYQNVPRKSPRKAKTLSIDSQTATMAKCNGPKTSPKNLARKSLEEMKRASSQDAEIFYSLEKDDAVLQQVTNEPLNLQRRSNKYAYGVEI